jgi:dolichyl-phosphate beta-glucosyltransferase
VSADWCTVVVPCYNEAARLPTGQFAEFLGQGYPIRFLFVNDGSKDGTLAILENFAASYPEQVEVLNKPVNQGKAEAVRDGMLQAVQTQGSRYIGFWDADLATPLNAIPDLLQKLTEDPSLEMIFGSRVRLLGREIHRKAVRHYLGRIFATVVSVLLRLAVYDTQCGAKLFRVTPGLSTILNQRFLSRWVFDVEILARFLALHNKDVEYAHRVIYEYPLDKWEDVEGSKVRPSDFLRAFADLLKIYRQYLRPRAIQKQA